MRTLDDVRLDCCVCGVANRAPAPRLATGDHLKCGRCGYLLVPSNTSGEDGTARVQGWSDVRRMVLERDHHQCVECGTACTGVHIGAPHVHHRIPRSLGGSDEPANLITLCAGCHAAMHPKLQAKLSRRLIELWAVRLAGWLGASVATPGGGRDLGLGLRLFGATRFRPGQLEVIAAALKGKSVLLVSPTGYGKGLCFQLPVVLSPGLSLVFSPLKALMAEQVTKLQRRMIPATFVNGDLDRNEKAMRYELLRRGVLKFLYCAPERFGVRDQAELQLLQRIRPRFIVVDEAHCVDKWGRDFRPDYGRLGEIRKALGSPPVLAFTATAGRETQERVLASLGVEEAAVFVHDVDRPNIALMRVRLGGNDRLGLTAQLLRIPFDGKAMIFVPTVKQGEALSHQLREQHGLDLPLYHAKACDAWTRETLVKRFKGELQPDIRAIICTNAFGMGLDIPNVRLVVHWQQPQSVEDYLQEFGRAGRDGRQALAVLFVNREDTGILEFMAKRTIERAHLPPDAAKQSLDVRCQEIRKMQDLAKARACVRQGIRRYFGAERRPKRRKMGWRILSWVFESRDRGTKQRFCCDQCERVRPGDELAFAQRVLLHDRKG
jgi:ATP-dependent DNA helicase RecQ